VHGFPFVTEWQRLAKRKENTAARVRMPISQELHFGKNPRDIVNAIITSFLDSSINPKPGQIIDETLPNFIKRKHPKKGEKKKQGERPKASKQLNYLS
jgi:hypothetical protein